jgi:ribose/xylose/arabinose/galactoside ABC-type transport system permease subunit
MTAVVSAPTATERRRAAFRRTAGWSMPILFVVLIVLATVTTPQFLTFGNLRAILINTAVTGIVAVGMTPVILSGNFFSLAAGQSTVLSTIVFLASVSSGVPLIVAALISVVVLVVVGVLQAFVVAAGLNPVVTTLAAGTIIFGLLSAVTGGAVVTAHNANIGWIATASLFGLPLPIYVFVVFALLVWLFVERTTAGRRVVLLGANRETAIVSGISVRSATIWAFVVMSIGMAIGGIVSAGELGQATSNDLASLTIDAVAAVLVGGAAIQGGEGSPIRSALGAIIIVILSNVMLLHGFPTGVRTLGEGVLVVIVVSALHLLRKVADR